MHPASRIPVAAVAYGEDVLARVAERIVAYTEGNPLAAERLVVLLPDLQCAPRLRRLLLRPGTPSENSAFLGPRIHTLRSWVTGHAGGRLPAVTDPERELILAEALRAHAGLFGETDPWRLSESLLALFDELTLHQVALPEELDAFVAALRRGYGVGPQVPAHLTQEAQVVHTLWNAWHEQLRAEGRLDAQAAYLEALAASAGTNPDLHFLMVGFDEVLPAEAAWMHDQLVQGQAELWLQGTPPATNASVHPGRALQQLADQLGTSLPPPATDNPQEAFFDCVFNHGGELLHRRAAAFVERVASSPVQGRLHILAAGDREQEAHGVDLQVRRWLLEGRQRIGIVTEDRRLARRVRALLERAGVILQDAGGWALSTTSAATVIERWLETVEEDFAHLPLMDLLKSPFLHPPGAEAVQYQKAVYRLEHDLILHENIARGLARFRRHLEYRRARLQWPAETADAVHGLLDRLEEAAAPLRALLHGRREQRVEAFFNALLESLERLGVQATLRHDAAGDRVIQELQRIRATLGRRNATLSWTGFRAWLGRALEQTHFRPATAASPVQLLNLAQSRLGQFDGVVFAAAEHDRLPGADPRSPYFNDAVRMELGLGTWEQTLSTRLYRFRRLLQAAPAVLITRRRDQDGETIPPSPWVDALETFHRLAYGADLVDAELEALLAQPGSRVRPHHLPPLPEKAARPAPQLPDAGVPASLSVGAHQRLVDCPYQFFAAEGLGLAPPDEIRETLAKSDYGERVHRCLEAFHRDVPGLPGPFARPVTEANREQAIGLLRDIARAQFARDLEDNFLHRGWLKRWLAVIPGFVDWEIQRQQQWRPREMERSAEQALAGGERLTGRVDRIDTDSAGRQSIVDYKTGHIPKQAELDSGEAVQLASYALLVPEAMAVAYLDVDQTPPRITAQLEGEGLDTLRRDVGERLETMLASVHQGAALPAWGDWKTCRYCRFAGVCRRQAWAGAQH